MNTENLKFDSKAAVAFGGNKMFLGKDFVETHFNCQFGKGEFFGFLFVLGQSRPTAGKAKRDRGAKIQMK